MNDSNKNMLGFLDQIVDTKFIDNILFDPLNPYCWPLTYCPYYNIKVSNKVVSDGPVILLLTFDIVTGIL